MRFLQLAYHKVQLKFGFIITLLMGAIWWGTRGRVPPTFSDGGT